MTKEIIRFINTELNIDITKKKKTNEYVFARTVYYKLCKELTKLPLEEIGIKVNKDHCSVIHNLKNFEQVIKIPKFKKLYFTFKEFPVEKDRYEYTEILKLNEQLRTELIDVKQKHRKTLEEIQGVGKVQQLLEGLTQQQVDLVHIRLDAMVKMIR